MDNRSTPDMGGPRVPRWGLAIAVALIFLSAHLPFLAPTLEDLDSVNFALGVRHFDPTQHQPHPPGYPFYIALGKLSTAALDLLHPSGIAAAVHAAPALEPVEGRAVRAENGALGLAIWSAVFGALAVFPLLFLFVFLDGDGASIALPALALTVACPLFWFTAVRPLSDVPGLAAALAGQALLAGAFVRQRAISPHSAVASPLGAPENPVLVRAGRVIVAGAFVSALAIGLRSQAIWLTLPLLGVVLLQRIGRGNAGRTALASVAALVVGTLLWLVPLIVFTGGVGRYLGALAKQGGEDFSGVDMFWTNHTPKRFVSGLLDTFVVPWSYGPLAVAVLLLAAAGLVVLLRRRSITIALLAAGFLPYAVFHLLFHETVTTRYALPLVPPVAYLAVCGAGALTGRLRTIVVEALVIASLVVVLPPVVRYGRDGSPVSHMFADMRRHSVSEGAGAVLALHRRILSETRRASIWELGGTTYWSRMLPSPRRHEWLELVNYWTAGGDQPVWFLAEPLRTDLALIDPASRRLITAYRWPFPTGPFVGGMRPGDIDWYEIRPPGWFVGEGWGLTPETAGVAQADGKSPDRGPIEAWVRRRPGATELLVGGRNLGGPNDPAARVEIAVDGRALDSILVKPAPGFFLRLFPLPAGSLTGEGRYARVTVVVTPADAGSQAVRAAVEQFDLQDESQVVYGYDQGWHELEYNPSTGRLWRWSSESANVRIHGAGHDVVLRVSGEVSPRDFSRPSNVTVRAGSVTLDRHPVTSAFTFEVAVAAAVLEQAGGLVTLETDQVFLPDDRLHNGDKRRLGLRIYGLTIRPQRDQGAR